MKKDLSCWNQERSKSSDQTIVRWCLINFCLYLKLMNPVCDEVGAPDKI